MRFNVFGKSSYSQHNGGCLEAGVFTKSTHSHSGATGDACLEAGVFQKSSYSWQEANCLEAGVFSKSSYSGGNGNCLEAGVYQKSSHSQDLAGNSQCVEAGIFTQEVRVADTTQQGDPHRPVLAFSPEAWQSFVDTLK